MDGLGCSNDCDDGSAPAGAAAAEDDESANIDGSKSEKGF